jgi:hypothetical protein
MDNSNTTDILSIIVRFLGLIVLLVGLYVGIKVILEAWHLYEEPQRIERFADAIEHGSNLDAVLTAITVGKPIPKQLKPETSTTTSKTAPALKVTYFLAWGIVVVLLMVIGSLASAAIRTGGQLALYDLQVKHFAKQLLKEAKTTKE